MKRFITLVCLCLFVLVGQAQSFEPRWVGQACILSIDNDTVAVPLEKANVQVKTTQSAGRLLVGIGNIRQKAVIKGNRSRVQVNSKSPITIIVKCNNNEIDPSTFIQVIKFEETRNERKTELGQMNWLDNISEGNMNLIPFSAEQYGKSSYILFLEPQVGEFGLRITNPNNADEKIPIFHCFGSHENKDVSSLIIQDGKEYYSHKNILSPVYKTQEGQRYIFLNGDKHFLPIDLK